jgi:hypothetical protein
MSVDPSILSALGKATLADPENAALRLHLAGLLLQADQPADALAHLSQVLSRDPAHVDALGLAARAADALGDIVRAEGYRRLHDALAGNAPPAPQRPAGNGRPAPDAPLPDLSLPPFPELAGGDPAGRPGSEDDDSRIRIGRAPRNPDDDGDNYWEAEAPKITLDDVAGMEDVKRRLNVAFLAPMKNPDMMRLYGKSLGEACSFTDRPAAEKRSLRAQPPANWVRGFCPSV